MRMSVTWDLSDVVLMIRPESWSSGVETAEVNCHSDHILSTRLMTNDVNLDRLLLLKFLHGKLPLFPSHPD